MSTNCYLKYTQQHRASWSVSAALRAAVCTSELKTLWPQARGTNRTQHTRATTAVFTAWTNLKITSETIIQVKAAEWSRKAHMHSWKKHESFKNSAFHFNTNTNDLITVHGFNLILRIPSPSIWSTTSQRAALVTIFLPHPNSSSFYPIPTVIQRDSFSLALKQNIRTESFL